jgi:hypothetical protein
MKKQEVETLIIQLLGEDRPWSSIVETICKEADLDWETSEQLVTQVRDTHQAEINKRQRWKWLYEIGQGLKCGGWMGVLVLVSVLMVGFFILILPMVSMMLQPPRVNTLIIISPSPDLSIISLTETATPEQIAATPTATLSPVFTPTPIVMPKPLIARKFNLVNGVCRKAECLFEPDNLEEGNYPVGLATIRGYYQQQKQTDLEETKVCDVFVVTDGPKELIRSILALIDSGNGIYHKNKANQPIIGLWLTGLKETEKTMLVTSTADKPVEIMVLAHEPGHSGAPLCFTRFEVLKIGAIAK